MSNNRRIQFAIGVFLLTVTFLLGGCCALDTQRSLDHAKQLAQKQDYAAIAAMKVSCEESCEGCNQLHLLKGDACYRLAKQGQEAAKNYSCAAAELSTGIQQTKQWQMQSFNLNRPQNYENLCESLRNGRDLSKGSEADAINTHLLQSAQEFRSAEPANACAAYFLANARYAQQHTCLLHPDKCPSLCVDLQAMLQQLNDAAPTAQGSHCAPNIQELKSEVTKAKELMSCQ
jgi:hypothetical protein